ncbi:hypothetical protein [Granulicella tundricola]|uniref:Uncharacterized protein n=1 Tax=Granulicella tundricola (strain ATCC BAA-1859 / DSM 23138 / MP5ACTX9) TaxID=1198114 RepID=E8X671_GRATM|nr:hypothetical protein [Granulicella tundricola]ADW70955.1 hypothetical protein AciX9_4176 [Granulicella tundricola MP5ACTX9]
MAIKFHPQWKIADPWYTQRYGSYQVFLDSVNQQQIMAALWAANGHFRGQPWVTEILQDAASTSQHSYDVTIEQGVHQPESYAGEDGFILHFTMRNSRGRAYHLYVKQKDNGALTINEISFMRNGAQVQVFYS